MEYCQSKEVRDVCEYHTALPAVPSAWTPQWANCESWTGLAPGRAYHTLAFSWKVEKASVCTAKQDKAPLFPSLSLSPPASKCGGFSRERKWQDYTHLPSLPTPFSFALTKSSALFHLDSIWLLQCTWTHPQNEISERNYPSSFASILIFWISSISEHLLRHCQNLSWECKMMDLFYISGILYKVQGICAQWDHPAKESVRDSWNDEYTPAPGNSAANNEQLPLCLLIICGWHNPKRKTGVLPSQVAGSPDRKSVV